MFKFPYTNLHELNLDWILEKVKKFAELIPPMETAVEDVQALQTDVEQAVEDANQALEDAGQALETAEEAKEIAEQAAQGTIADGAVTTAKLDDGAVTTAKLADGAVTGNKIGTATIQTGNLSQGCVTTVQILDGTITDDDLGTGCVTADKLGTSAVTTGKINDSAVTTNKIADGAVTANKLASGVLPTVVINSEHTLAITTPFTGTLTYREYIYDRVTYLQIIVHVDTQFSAGARVTVTLDNLTTVPYGATGGVNVNNIVGYIYANKTLRLQNNFGSAINPDNNVDVGIVYLNQ